MMPYIIISIIIICCMVFKSLIFVFNTAIKVLHCQLLIIFMSLSLLINFSASFQYLLSNQIFYNVLYIQKEVIINSIKMQTHSKWVDNKKYEQHLNSLTHIKSKSRNITLITKKSSQAFQQYTSKNKLQQIPKLSVLQCQKQNPLPRLLPKASIEQLKESIMFKEIQTQNQQNSQKLNQTQRKLTIPLIKSLNATMMSNFKSSRVNKPIDIKKQQVLWSNFLLGKRILETNPVISKRKFDQDFKRHQQILKSKMRNYQQNEFKNKKLQQHKELVQKFKCQHKLSQKLRSKKHLVCIKIENIQILKYHQSSLQSILLIMKYQKPQSQIKPSCKQKAKKIKQTSQCISSCELTRHQFFFNLKLKAIQEEQPIIVEIKNVKGLEIVSIGTFCFTFHKKTYLQHQQAKLYNFGKLIGQITFSANYGRKQDYLANH